ncbi:MAG: Gfo/Idh/MocA family oxidoreductase [Planctomycetota bacterium]
MSKLVRLAMVGCGGMAKGHLNAYKTIWARGGRNFNIVATCDVKRERAEDFATQAEAFQGKKPRVYADIKDMLKDGDIDAVDIAAPHGFHHILAVPCLEAKMDIMVEKPIGITCKATRIILDAAERSKRLVAVAENLRRYVGQRCVYWIINEAKLLGNMRMFFAQKTGWYPMSLESEPMQWRGERLVGGGGLIFDSGAHYMDTIRYLFGDADRVFAQMRTYERRPFKHPERGEVVGDVEDSWTATIVFKSGVVGVWSYFPAARGKALGHAVYYGDKGSFEDLSGDIFHGLRTEGEVTFEDGKKRNFKDLEIEYLVRLTPEQKAQLFPYGLTDGVQLECADFIDAVANRRKPDVDGLDGFKAKAIAIAIYESAWTGKSVLVDDVIEGKVDEYQKDINERWGMGAGASPAKKVSRKKK